MPEFSLRTVRVSLALMTFAGYLALATTDSFGPEIALAPLVVIASMRFFERLDGSSAAYRALSQVGTVVFIVIIVPLLVINLITGLTAIIVYIQVYLLLHRKGVKEYRYLFLMAFFLLVDAVAQSPDAAFGLVVPVFVLSAVWAFASVQIYAEIEANRGGNVADLLPAEFRRGFLPPEVAQWIAGSRRDTMNVAPVLSGVSLGCVTATLLFFVLTPRMDAGIFGRSNFTAPTQRTGLDNGVNLSRGGRIAADEAPVFMARFPNEPPGARPDFGQELYWRVTSYNRLIGAEWDRVDGDLTYIEWRGRYGQLDRQAPPRGRDIVQEIFLQDARNLPGIPALPGVFGFRPISTARLRLDGSESLTVQIIDSASSAASYQAISRVPQWTRDELVAARADYPDDFDGRILMARYTEQRLSERARALAEELTAGAGSVYEKAEAVGSYLRDSQNFFYTTTLEELSSSDPIEDFLFAQRRGHCELYASAMCMLLRSVGIPSRVVAGYREGDWSPGDSAYIVRQRHAHMWVEVFINPKLGWVMFDPSGVAEEDNTLWAAFQRVLGRYSMMAQYTYYRDIIGYNSGIQLGELVQISLGIIRFDVDTMRQVAPRIRALSTGLPAMVVVACIIVALVWGFVVMYRAASASRRTGSVLAYSPDQVRATRVYGRLRKRLVALGTATPSGGARAWIEAAKSDPSIDTDEVARIVRAYHDARFGGRPLDRQRYGALMQAVRGVKRQAPSPGPSLAEQ